MGPTFEPKADLTTDPVDAHFTAQANPFTETRANSTYLGLVRPFCSGTPWASLESQQLHVPPAGLTRFSSSLCLGVPCSRPRVRAVGVSSLLGYILVCSLMHRSTHMVFKPTGSLIRLALWVCQRCYVRRWYPSPLFARPFQ